MDERRDRILDEYAKLLERRSQVDDEIRSLRQARKLEIIEFIIELLEEFEINIGDIMDRTASGERKRRAKPKPKYYDPVSGATWSGRGKKPKWLGGRNPNDFLLRENFNGASDD